MRLRAGVVDNGVYGLAAGFRSNARVEYAFLSVGPDFAPDLSGLELLIVPNGSDQEAMSGIADRVAAFLNRGGALFCFDGWFGDWLPGNRWVGDSSKPTRDIRYRVGRDRHGLLNGVPLEELTFHHGVSGWWACGYIEPAMGADAVLVDTWGRAVAVLDDQTAAGPIFLTASGPLANGPVEGKLGLKRFFDNLIDYAARRKGAAV